MNIEERARVIVTDAFGTKYKGTVVNVSDYREPSMKYAVELDIGLDDYVFVGEDQIILYKEDLNNA